MVVIRHEPDAALSFEAVLLCRFVLAATYGIGQRLMARNRQDGMGGQKETGPQAQAPILSTDCEEKAYLCNLGLALYAFSKDAKHRLGLGW